MNSILYIVTRQKNIVAAVGFAVMAFSFLGTGPAFCEGSGPAEASGWRVIESNNFTVYYKPEADMERIERSLRKRTSYLGGDTLDDEAAVEEKVAHRFDVLLNRAKEILGMHPKMPKVKVRIFNDRNGLADEYTEIFGARKEYKSFYVHKYETIYTSEEDISDSVIAHEMGHAVVDHYFAVVPPGKVSEIIATYVDMHLEE